MDECHRGSAREESNWIEGLFEFRASKRGEKIGWRVAKPAPEGIDQDEEVMVPAFVRLFKHWKGTTKVGDEVVEVTAWLPSEPGDEVEAAQVKKKRRGGRGKEFGLHQVVNCLPLRQALSLQQIVPRVQAAAKAKGAKQPSQRTIQRLLGQAVDAGLVEHKGRGYIRPETAKE